MHMSQRGTTVQVGDTDCTRVTIMQGDKRETQHSNCGRAACPTSS